MFNKVVIIGVGLLGGSLAKDLRRHSLAKEIIGVCRSQETSDEAISSNIVDSVEPLEQAVQGADLIVLATPMQSMLPILMQFSDNIAEGTVITDVGSVKGELYTQIKRQCPQLLARFVLAHPIAGGESSGVNAARDQLFVDKHVIITQTDEVEAQYVERVKALWQHVGANVVTMSLMEHDAIFAKTSHLPHAIAFTLVNFLDKQADRDVLFDMAAAGFYDFTRIASSNAQMWRDICITNQQQVLIALEGFQNQLSILHKAVSDADQEAILTLFEQAKAARDHGLSNKQA